MDNIKIYICTHKDFIPIVHSDSYETIDSRNITPNLPLKDDFYSEFYQFKWLAEQDNLPEYVGFCHYRRYFSFLDEIPSLTQDKAIAATPMVFNASVYAHYAHCHNGEDLDIISDIIDTKYPEYKKTKDEFLNGNVFIPNNMFIMHKDKFKEYIKFIISILDEYLKRVGTDIYKRIEQKHNKYIKNFHPNDTAEYQYRIGGFLGERCTNIFLFQNFKQIDCYDMIITEEKYDKK